jgi:uncharacterized protein
VRLTVHVRPGATRAGIGGSHDGALVIRVREPASDGRANDAVVRAVADELGLARRAVRIVAGTRSRRKVVELDGDGDALAEGLARLRARA